MMLFPATACLLPKCQAVFVARWLDAADLFSRCAAASYDPVKCRMRAPNKQLTRSVRVEYKRMDAGRLGSSEHQLIA